MSINRHHLSVVDDRQGVVRQSLRKSLLWTLPVLAVRGLLVVAVIWLGCANINILSELRSPALARQKTAAPIKNIPTAFLRTVDSPAAGHWTIGEWKWRVGSRKVSQHDMREAMAGQFAKDISAAGPVDRGELELINVLRRISPRTPRIGNRQVFQYSSAGAYLQLIVVDKSKQSRLHSASLAIPLSGDEWQLWELLPTPATAASRSAGVCTHLLQLPANANRIAARWTDAGELILEIVTLEADVNQLLGLWKAAGWRQRKHALSLDNSLLFERHGSQVYVWSPEDGQRVRTLILVATPPLAR